MIRTRTERQTRTVLLLSLLVLCSLPSHSESTTIRQMVHTSWTARDGAPQALRVIAQAKDGTLWLGGQSGLHNFDGRTFTEFKSAPGQPGLPSTNILSLCVAPDGALWVSMHGAGVARIVNGMVTLYSHADGQELSYLENLHVAPDGSIWGLNRRQVLVRLGSDGAWHTIESPLGNKAGDPHTHGYFFDNSGTLWVAQGGQLFMRSRSAPSYSAVKVPVDQFFSMIDAGDGTLWISDDDNFGRTGARTRRIDKLGNLLGGLKLPEVPVQSLAIGPDDSLFLGTRNQGLLRVAHPDLPASGSVKASAQLDHYVHIDGLSSDHIFSVLVDASGNLWTAGDAGLDRFRLATLVPFESEKEGNLWSVCADSHGVTWIGSASIGLYRIATGSVKHVLSSTTDDVYSLSCATRASAWAVDSLHIWKLGGEKAKAIPQMPHAYPNMVDQVAESSTGDLFVNLDKGDLWLYKSGAWRELDSSASSGGLRPLTIYMDSQDRLWAGFNHGIVGLWANGRWNPLPANAPSVGAVWALGDSSHGLVAAGINGFAIVRGGHLQPLHLLHDEDAKGLTGIAQTSNGDLWINGVHGIVHVASSEFDAAVYESAYQMRSELIAEGDYIGPAPLARYSPSIARGEGDQLWIVTASRVVSLDPSRIHQVPEQPKLLVRGIQSDGQPLNAARKVQPLPQTLTIRYFGVNLTAPEKVIYRYQLVGADQGWQEAGARTEAIYTHLRPGNYTFEVEASNGDGVWTLPLTADPFSVLPSFYQTWWFTVLCACATLLLCWMLITLRVRYLATLIRARAEERADERVRIARDLHDTLLQGVQGLSLSFHAAASALAPENNVRKKLENALLKADRIITEGRDKVSRLRCEELSDAQLIEQLESVGEELRLGTRTEFDVQRAGVHAELKSHVIDELFNIGREALTNAFQHSGASQIRVTLSYEKHCFILTCKDNGCGFDNKLGDGAYKKGHWGLRGMGERAERIGGRFSYSSTPASGTEIVIRVPSSRAYKKRRSALLNMFQIIGRGAISN